MTISSLHVSRYLFTLDLPEFWENKHADQTLEVLMSDLDPAVMDQFYMKDGVSANDVTRVSMSAIGHLERRWSFDLCTCGTVIYFDGICKMQLFASGCCMPLRTFQTHVSWLTL